jgi:integrase
MPHLAAVGRYLKSSVKDCVLYRTEDTEMKSRINLGKKSTTKISKPINRTQLLELLNNYLVYTKRYAQTSVKSITILVTYLLNNYDLSVIDANKAQQIEESYKARGAKNTTIKHMLEALEHIAACQGIVNDDGTPLRFSKPKLVRSEVKSLSVTEARALLSCAMNARDKAIIAVLLFTGVRCKELVALDIGDIDLKNRVIHVRAHDGIVKNYRERTCVITKECASILSEWIAIRPVNRSTALFLNTYGERLVGGSIHRIVATTARVAEIDKRTYTHLLRHTCATIMLRSGIPITEVALQLGHRSLQSTMVYLHGNLDDLKEDIDRKFSY